MSMACEKAQPNVILLFEIIRQCAPQRRNPAAISLLKLFAVLTGHFTQAASNRLPAYRSRSS